MINSGLPSRVYYAAYNPETKQFVSGDQDNHTVALVLDGSPLAATNAPTNAGGGVYEVILTDAERLGIDLVVSAETTTEGLVIAPVHYSADQRWNELLEDDGAGTLRNTAKSLEEAPNDTADTSGLALEASVQAIITTGGTGPWTTADGFTVPTDLDGLALEASVQSIITTGGTGPWTTATGFATPDDLSALALEETVDAVGTAVQTVITTGGPGPWTTGSGGGAGEQDWTDTERSHIRNRLGIDGTAAVPSATPTLALDQTVVDGINAVLAAGGTGPWTTAAGFTVPSDLSGLALEATVASVGVLVQSVLDTGGTGPWTGGDPVQGRDWTDDELNQLRYRLGVDGAAAMPTAEPDLAQESDLENLDVNVVSFGGSTDVLDKFIQANDSIRITTVDDANTAPTNTEFDTPLTEADVDHWKNRSVIMMTGELMYQASVITGYQLVAGKGQITVAGFTRAPAAGDSLLIV